MAISVVQHVPVHGAAGSASQNITVSSTGSGRLLIAWCSAGSHLATIASVSDGTNSFTRFGSGSAAFASSAGVDWCSDLYYLLSSTAGKTTITANYNSTNGGKSIIFWEVSGFTSPVEDGASAQGSGALANPDYSGPSLVTTGSIGFLIGGVLDTNSISSNPKAGNAFTAGGDILSSGDAGCSLISSASGTYTPIWTSVSNGDGCQAFVAAFKESGGGGVVDSLEWKQKDQTAQLLNNYAPIYIFT